MNNSNDPMNDQVSPAPEQQVAAPATPPPSVAPQPTAKKSRNWLAIGVIIVLFLLLLALIPVAYALGRMSAVTDLSKNISTDTSSTSDAKTEDKVDKATTETLGEYNGWNTYENTTYGYSFKYPADWKVDRDVIQNPADWVSINPPSGKNASGGDVLAIYTYFDGVGCPATKTKQFTIGGYEVKGIACAETEIYKMSMNHSKAVSKSNQGVILARAASSGVGIQIDMGRGENETLQRILDSVMGLTP